MLLHDLHQRLVGELGELAARPVAVVRTRRSARRCAAAGRAGRRAAAAAVSWQRCSGLVTTAASGSPASRPGSAAACGGAALVEGDAGRPAREHARRCWRWSVRAVRGSAWACGASVTASGPRPAGPPAVRIWRAGPGRMRGVIVDCAIYRDGRRTEGPADFSDALDQARATGDAFLWIGLHEPTREGVRPGHQRVRAAPAGRRGRAHARTSGPSWRCTTTRCSWSSSRWCTSRRATPSPPVS